MDFQIPPTAGAKRTKQRRTIVLACASKPFFSPYIRQTVVLIVGKCDKNVDNPR